MKSLNYFIGKVCTIFTTPINRTFQERQSIDYFVGRIEAIDEFGIMTSHAITGCKNYFFLKHIIGVSEEQVLNPEKPEDAKLLEEFQAMKKLQTSEESSPFVDLDQLKALSKLSKSKS